MVSIPLISQCGCYTLLIASLIILCSPLIESCILSGTMMTGVESRIEIRILKTLVCHVTRVPAIIALSVGKHKDNVHVSELGRQTPHLHLDSLQLNSWH